MLVHAYATLPRKAKWSGTHHTIKMLHDLLFHSITCYTNSLISHIHVNNTKLRNITCPLIATCEILRSLECPTYYVRFNSSIYAPLSRHDLFICSALTFWIQARAFRGLKFTITCTSKKAETTPTRFDRKHLSSWGSSVITLVSIFATIL